MSRYWRIGTLLALALLASCRRADLPPQPDLGAIVQAPGLGSSLQPLLAELANSPNDSAVNGRTAALLHAYQQYSAASTFYERAALLAPEQSEWPYLLGVVLAEQGRTDEAARQLERALDLMPSYAPAWRRLGALRHDQGRLNEARRCFDKALNLRSADAEARLGLGRVEIADGRLDEAIAQIRRSLEFAPGFGAAHYELSLALRDAGDRGAAAEHAALYEQTRYGVPASDDPYLDRVARLNASSTEYLQQAAEAQRQGNIERAVELTRRAADADPDLAQAFLNLLILYGSAGKYPEAEQAYRKAVKLAPSRADLHYNYGVMAFRQGRREEAKLAFEMALTSNPDYAAAHNNYGQLLELEGRPNEALAHYEKALDARPNYRLARYHLARMLMARRQFAEAAAQLEKIIAPEDNESPEYLFALAAAYQRLQRRPDAEATAGRALRLAQGFGQDELAAAIRRAFAGVR